MSEETSIPAGAGVSLCLARNPIGRLTAVLLGSAASLRRAARSLEDCLEALFRAYWAYERKSYYLAVRP